MDKDLITRISLVVVAVALYLIAARVEFYPYVIAPITVVVVAVVMFWPRRTDSKHPTTREEIRNIREETRR